MDDFSYLNTPVKSWEDERPYFVMYSLASALIAWCILLPPTEFIAAGLTIESIFHKFLGRGETLTFIDYHIRRIVVTVMAQSMLPIVYFMFMDLMLVHVNVHTPAQIMDLSLKWQIPIAGALLLPVAAALLCIYWLIGDKSRHPIVQALTHYDKNWRSVASSIDNEFRRLDKFSIALGGVRRLIVTDSWIVYVCSHSVVIARQADCQVLVVGADEHHVSHHSTQHERDIVQFLNLSVRERRDDSSTQEFSIRVNARDYRDLKDKLTARVSVARDVIIKASTGDMFVKAFEQSAEENGTIEVDPAERDRIDACLGCGGVRADVKSCDDAAPRPANADGQPQSPCAACFCRPMWCVLHFSFSLYIDRCRSCMARWFAMRQPQDAPGRWLSGKAPCPTCRAVFCMLDVRFVTGLEPLGEGE